MTVNIFLYSLIFIYLQTRRSVHALAIATRFHFYANTVVQDEVTGVNLDLWLSRPRVIFCCAGFPHLSCRQTQTQDWLTDFERPILFPTVQQSDSPTDSSYKYRTLLSSPINFFIFYCEAAPFPRFRAIWSTTALIGGDY
jgi:hypothetical protein